MGGRPNPGSELLNAPPREELRVVVLGVTPSSVRELQRILHALLREPDLCFYVLPLTSAPNPSLAIPALRRWTSLSVLPITQGVKLRAGGVFVQPGRRQIEVRGAGSLHAVPPSGEADFASVTLVRLGRLFGEGLAFLPLVPSGDLPLQGMEAVRDRGGRILRISTWNGQAGDSFQDEDPQVDLDHFHQDVRRLWVRPVTEPSRNASVTDRAVRVLGRVLSLDHSSYCDSLVSDALYERMMALGIDSTEEYLARVGEERLEARELSTTILGRSEAIFTDRQAFVDLEQHVFPTLFASLGDDQEFRIWVPGCGTGEDVHALTIALHEYMEANGRRLPVRIFGTDVDPRSVAQASEGRFGLEIEARLSAERLQKGFQKNGDGYRIQPALRESMVFAVHNAAIDPPFTHIHLIFCRRLLSLYKEHVRDRIWKRFHYALEPKGFLFLGQKIDNPPAIEGFQQIRSTSILHQKRTSSRACIDELMPKPTALSVRTRLERSTPRGLPYDRLERICASIVESRAECGLLVDLQYSLLHVFGRAESYLSLAAGQASFGISQLTQGDLRIVLLSSLDAAREKGEPRRVESRIELRGETRVVRIEILPLGEGKSPDQYLVLLDSRAVEGDEPVEDIDVALESRERVHVLERELATTRERMRVILEEAELGREELQTANEELLATNEQLQISNEELQSVNEELYTVNAEYRKKIDQLTELSGDMDHLLNSTDIGTVFLDRNLHVRKYTPIVRTLIPLMPSDIGRPLAHISHSLEVDLEGLAKRVLETGEEAKAKTEYGSGEWLLVRCLPYRLPSGEMSGCVVTFLNISDIEMARQQLAKSEQMFRQLAENIQEILWMCDPATQQVIFVGRKFTEVWGVPPGKLYQDPSRWLDPVHPEDRAHVSQTWLERFQSGELDIEYRVIDPGGSIHWIRDRAFPIHDEHGRLYRVAGIAADETENKLAQEKLRVLATELEEQANRDPLTRLLNRRGLEKVLGKELVRCRRDGVRLIAALIDCDHFKGINDTLGYSVGDVTLREIAQRLLVCLRPTDSVARVGGDEFLVLLPSTRLAEAMQVAERLRLAIGDSPLRAGERTLTVTASIGVSAVSPDSVSIEEVISRTQLALKHSKESGRNRVYSTHQEGAVGHRGPTPQQMILSRLLDASSYRIFSQTIRRTDDGRVVGHELLSRGPSGPFEDPADFFRAAMEHNTLTSVDLLCLRHCLAQASIFAENESLHVNVFPSTLLDTSPSTFRTLLENLPRKRSICFEISEQQFLGDPSCMLEQVHFLKSLGLSVGIDDVGFGRSSLESVIVLQPDVIKIDRSFVHGVSRDPVKRSNLARLLRVGQGLEARVIAEGVETQEDWKVVADLGIHFAQGYYWERPMEVLVPRRTDESLPK